MEKIATNLAFALQNAASGTNAVVQNSEEQVSLLQSENSKQIPEIKLSSQDLQNAILEAEKETAQPVEKKSGNLESVGFFDRQVGRFVDLFDKNTKDGKIEDTKQGQTGDCYLLSAISALSYNEKGAQMIKDCLEYDDKGTTVHLKGVGDYYVSNDEVAQTKGSDQYSNGDDDMIIFELAVEKVRNDMANGDAYYLDDDKSESIGNGFVEMTSSTKDAPSIANGGLATEVLYYITGKTADLVYNKEDITQALDNFQQNNGKDYCASVGLYNDTIAISPQGETIELYGPHAYSIKNVSDNTVTITNPWDSSKDLIIQKENFIEVIDDMEILNLSESPEDNLIEKTTTEITQDEHNKYITTKDNKGRTLKQEHYDQTGIKYSQDEFEYKEDGTYEHIHISYEIDGSIRKTVKKEYDSNGNVSQKRIEENNKAYADLYFYDKETNVMTGDAHFKYDENGNNYETQFFNYDENGKLKLMEVKSNPEQTNS